LNSLNAPLIFDSEFLSKLEQLYVLSKKLFRGDHHAERRSRQTGSSLEFADYRNYNRGDDLRRVDWNIYGRLDRLVVKLFEQEQDLHLHFLIDASESMRWKAAPGTRPGATERPSKLDTARRIAASLAYIGLANLDRVNIHWFGSSLEPGMGLARGRSQFHQVLDFLRQPPELEGPTRLLDSARLFAQQIKRRGMVFVLSDLFDPDGCQEALARLRHSQFEVQVVQVLDPAEIRPESSGDLKLIEGETGQSFDLTATGAILERYHQEIDRFLQETLDFCHQRAIAYVQASTAACFEDLVLRVLRDGRIVE
jgi:uncharacterized protein (DUF58 family)